MVRLLVEKGVEADSKDKYRQTPLLWATGGPNGGPQRGRGAAALDLVVLVLYPFTPDGPSTRKIAHCTIF